MSETLLRLYHHLPAPARSIAASLRGFQLRSWRYGPDTERLILDTLDRESWSPEQWKSWQQERLSLVLHRAATRVPFYREMWAERRRRGDRSSWKHLENWPILEKEQIRQTPRAFLAEDRNARQMFREHTSGTTGKSLELLCSKETLQQWYALFEARCRSWYGVSRNDRWGILGGQLIVSAKRERPPFWVWNKALNQLYLSSYHLSPRLIPSYLDALIRYRVKYLVGYTSSLYELAKTVLRLRRRDLKLAVVVTNAEPVFDYQRRAIEEAFQCSVRETYGMSEMVAAASECLHGELHLWPEAGILEVANEVSGNGKSASGELVSTGLVNLDMPLIRYRVGDCGTLSNVAKPCPCGRTLPVLRSLDGRSDDVLYTADGRHVGRLDPIFKGQMSIVEAQIVQEALDVIRVNYVPASNASPDGGVSIAEQLRARMGDVKVILNPMDVLPRGTNGKFRAVVCNLSAKERQSLEAAR